MCAGSEVSVDQRCGGADLLRHRLRGERHELHQPACAGRADRADVEAALLADQTECHRRIDRTVGWFGGDRPAGLRQDQAVTAHAARDEHRGVGQADAQSETRRQGAVRGIRRKLVHAQQEGACPMRIVPGDQHGSGAHHLAVGERQHLIACIGGVVQRGDAARQCRGIVAQRERGKLTIECRRPRRRTLVFRLRITARSGDGTAEPVMRAALRDRRLRQPGERREVPRRRGGIVQPAQRDEAGKELRVQLLLRRDPAVPVGERVGVGGVAIVQQATCQQVALGPERGELIRRRIVLCRVAALAATGRSASAVRSAWRSQRA